MKKNSKKIISLFLVFVLLFSMSYSAFAAAAETVNRVSVTLTSDKKQYKSGEEIKLQTKIKNSTGSKQYVSVTYRATPFAKFDDADKYSIKYAEIENETSNEFSAIAKAKHSSFAIEWVQKIYDAVFGSFWSAIYMIVAMFNSNYEPVSFKVDGIPAVVMAEVSSSMTLPGEDTTNKKTYTVTFDSNGGKAIPSQNVKEGECAVTPDFPTNGNLMFAGWYTEKEPKNYKDVFSFTNPINKDMTLYALWIDTNTDTDNDGLSDDIEKRINTNISSSDSDNDGINDYLEIMLFNYDPKSDDTDGNGIKDSEEDHDGDKLSNEFELKNGTNPILKDSDSDDLDDYEEICKYHTDPLKADTDEDGASDGDEVRLGTDPLKADKVFYENDRLGETSEKTPVTIEVEATVSGSQVGTMKITPVTSATSPAVSPTIPGYLGSAYDISISGHPESATLYFKYDLSLGKIGEDFQPRIYYFDEKTGTFEELPNQRVSEGEVSANVEHFSTYILLNKVKFDKVWETEIKPPEYQENDDNNLDIVFVIDYSQSMVANDPTQLFKKVSKEFIAQLRDNKDRAGVVKFVAKATLVNRLSYDKNELINTINSISYDNGYNSDSGTNGSDGINTAINELKNSEARYKYICFITDGEDNRTSYSYNDLINRCNSNGINVYSIGMGSSDNELLKNVASKTSGKFFYASTASELNEIYDDIKIETIDYVTDSNNDGISDYYTKLIKEGKLPLSNGSLEFRGYDFNYDENGNPSDDYDNDGVKNGDELVVKQKGNSVYLYMVSDPTMEHSDCDGYSDFEEHANGSDPMVNSYNAYAVDYPTDDGNFTYVQVYKEESDWINSTARNIWSTATLNWSHQDEAKLELGSILKSVSNLDDIKNISNNVSMEMYDEFAETIIGEAIEMAESWADSFENYTEGIKAIKKWIAAGHSARNITPDSIVKLKAQCSLFERNYLFKFNSISKFDVIGSGIGFAIDTAEDIYNHINAYSALVAIQSEFITNKDILVKLKESDNAKEKFVSRAAEDILLLVDERYDAFKKEQVKDFATDAVANLAGFAWALLSGTNPWLICVDIIMTGLEVLTPTTKIADATYSLYVVDELVKASRALFSYDAKSGNYYNLQNNDVRYIKTLIVSRIWGSSFARQVTDNQIFIWGKSKEKQQEFVDAYNYDIGQLNFCLNNFM